MSSQTAHSPSPPPTTANAVTVSSAARHKQSPPPDRHHHHEDSLSPSWGSPPAQAVPSSSNQSSGSSHDDDENASNAAGGDFVRWIKKPRRKRAGWGPYQSVLNERSVDFNLTLDVQSLKQEIHTMEILRDILASKTMLQRHDPEGSLVRIVQEHYRIFRTGFNLRQSGRKRVMNEQDQREFLHSVFDEHVDVGGDENGIHVLEQQIQLYTVFIKAIAMTMTGFEVIVTEDSVVVATKGILHFQILRNTIAGMFPHVMGEEWLVSKLVGREVAPATKLSFYFNKHNKVCKFVAELDYIKTFAEVLTDPAEVDILLGRALITENCLIIPSDDTDPTVFERPHADSVVDTSSSPSKSDSNADSGCDTEDRGSSPRRADAENSDHSAATLDIVEPEPELPASPVLGVATPAPLPAAAAAAAASSPHAPKTPKTSAVCAKQMSPAVNRPASALTQVQSTATATMPTARRGPMTPVDHFNHVVEMYFRVFGQGSHPSTETAIAQFLDRNFSRIVVYGEAVGRQVITDRWRSLSWCFNVLSFRRLSSSVAAVYEPKANRYRIKARAEYTLQLTRRSMELVFPHVASNRMLSNLLTGSLVLVASEIRFWLERATGLLVEVQEQMDFASAFSTVVSNAEDLAFVLAGATPILMSFSGEVPVSMSHAVGANAATAPATDAALAPNTL